MGQLHFTSRAAMDISGMGERIVEDMYNYSFIKTIPDIYKLERFTKDIMMLEGYAKNYQMRGATAQTAHMFIINPFSGFARQFSSLFSTHPSTQARLQRLAEIQKQLR